MDKLKLHTPDLTAANIDRIAALFPNCVTETKDESGNLKRAIDFDLLRQELTPELVEGPQERYRLDWPGKREALALANTPVALTLRPCREESVDFETTQNLYIEGDNLDALKLLQETYLGKVKMIYIDPPYNTGSDFIYDDDFSMSRTDYQESSGAIDHEGNAMFDEEKWKQNSSINGRFHSEWLSMIYPRLKLARNLLAQDGILLVSIDDNEISRLRALCDEIFGSTNFVECFVWKRRYGGGAKEKHIVSIHEYILMYALNKDSIPDLYVGMSGDQVTRYYKLKDENHAKLGPYRLQPLEPADSMADRPNLRFAVPAPDGTEIWPKRQWLWGKEKFDAAIKSRILNFSKKDGKWQVSRKQYLQDEDGEQRKTKQHSIIDGIFGQQGSAELAELFENANSFSFPKPSALIYRLIEIVCPEGVVMDFFSGSATTAHAVMQLNAEDGGKRRHIMVQLPEPCDEKSEAFKAGYKTIAEIGKERIRRAGKKVLSEWQAKHGSSPEHLKLETENSGANAPDVGFRVLKIADSNFRDIERQPDALDQQELALHTEHIKPERTAEDLLFQVLVDWGVDLALPIVSETLHGKRVFFVDQNALAACFDTGLTDELIQAIAARKPLRAVFRDDGFGDDSTRINVEQIFKLLSPATEVKSL